LTALSYNANMAPPQRIETDRLVLRIPALDDARALFETYTQDARVTRYVIWRPHTHIEQTLAFLKDCVAGWESGKRFPYVITLKNADNPVGMVDLHIVESTVGIGYVIGRAYWGQGYVPEAIRAIVEWAFSQPEINRIYATCDVENKASARVMEKVGMQREGLLQKHSVHPNLGPEPRDSYIYVLMKPTQAV
jgi:[ribosomal protein S5]-alanine N-acetyltransferase